MTRINCLPVESLCDKHLVAEYRELPRIAKLAEKAFKSGRKVEIPSKYVLGKGHVLFFYDKGKYLHNRHSELCEEMRKRGFTVNFPEYPETHPLEWFNDWSPNDSDKQVNQKRIEERLLQMSNKS